MWCKMIETSKVSAEDMIPIIQGEERKTDTHWLHNHKWQQHFSDQVTSFS